MPLLAEEIDDVGEIAFRGAGDDVSRGRPRLPHPHVERPVEAEREAAAGLVELHRGDADVHHHAIDGVDALGRADLGEIRETVLDQRQPAGGTLDQLGATGDRRAIAIDRDQAGSRHVEYRSAITTGAERRINIDAALARREMIDRLAAKHGNVGHGTHAPCLPNDRMISGARKPITPRMIPRRGGSTTQPLSSMLAEPGRPRWHARCSQWNLSGSHGISSQERFGRLRTRVGSSPLSNGP